MYLVGVIINILVCWLTIEKLSRHTSVFDFAWEKEDGRIVGCRLTYPQIFNYICIFAIIFFVSWIGTFVLFMIFVSSIFVYLAHQNLVVKKQKQSIQKEKFDYPF